MPRILGVDIPKEKRIDIALTYIYGVGRHSADLILKEAKIDPSTRAQKLSEKEISDITAILQRSYKTEGDLRREIQLNIKRLMEIRVYRGLRHIKGLPVRGQRTHTTARTRKGPRKVVSGANKKPPSAK